MHKSSINNKQINEPTSLSVIRLPSATMGAVPLVQVNLRKEPLAEQVRITVLLCSMASGMLDLMTTSDTGSAGRTRGEVFNTKNKMNERLDDLNVGERNEVVIVPHPETLRSIHHQDS